MRTQVFKSLAQTPPATDNEAIIKDKDLWLQFTTVFINNLFAILRLF